jgi:hypothetical protein
MKEKKEKALLLCPFCVTVKCWHFRQWDECPQKQQILQRLKNESSVEKINMYKNNWFQHAQQVEDCKFPSNTTDFHVLG